MIIAVDMATKNHALVPSRSLVSRRCASMLIIEVGGNGFIRCGDPLEPVPVPDDELVRVKSAGWTSHWRAAHEQDWGLATHYRPLCVRHLTEGGDS